mgnify:CR=1 FL=1
MASNTNTLTAPRLKTQYKEQIVPTMHEEFEYDSIMAVPKLIKISLNIGLGEALTNGRALESAINDLTSITGQRPVTTRARKSIANFKLREGNPIGCAVTLRGNRMYYFLDRLINTALPRIRDFRGLPRKGFDGRGNFSLGLREQIIFPEINYDNIDKIRGMDICINTSASNKEDAKALLEVLNFPFKK